ncbi:hypothetical protein ACIQVK_18845 [Streptomyces sp. NPDC090493]|uniref:hypothetical protein n=1 Tax=Streptomyces sp. NPDC090493 TaxID=3365964 RepID=UPI00380556AA
MQRSARIDVVVRAQLGGLLTCSVVCQSTIRISFADQMIVSSSVSSESAVLIECLVIPSPESAAPIRLALFAELSATPSTRYPT